MSILDFFWPSFPAELADEAVSAVGVHASRRHESIVHLREMEKRLHANIRREMDALKAVQAAIEREEAADAAVVVEAAAAEIEEGIGLALIDCTATTAESVTTEAQPKRKSKLAAVTSEAA